jgi:hypothetical protein
MCVVGLGKVFGVPGWGRVKAKPKREAGRGVNDAPRAGGAKGKMRRAWRSRFQEKEIDSLERGLALASFSNGKIA